MTATRQNEGFRLTIDLGDDRIHLPQGPILIICALNYQDRYRYGSHVFLDIPRPELRPQPDVGPALEHRSRVLSVIPREATRQIGAVEDLIDSRNAVDADIFHEDVGSKEDEGT